MTGRKLAVNTTVGGVTYEAGSTPDPEVAEQITNPAAWGEEPDDAGEEKPAKKAAAKRSGK